MGETKQKPVSSLRTPRAKKKLGLSVPPALRLPHEALMETLAEGEATMPSLTSQTTPTSQTRHTDASNKSPEAVPSPVAPSRDYSKVANSIVREAIPAGVFAGKSKQLYDCLYALTRGAVVPSRTVRISRPKLMKRARIGARVTFDANVERLIRAGLIQVRQIAGEHEGNEFTVHLPEEVSMTSHTTLTSHTSHAQNLVRLDSLETSQTSHTSCSMDATTSGESKTSLKTTTKNDDEASTFSDLIFILSEAAGKLTGRAPKQGEREQWAQVARIVVDELNEAAGRAGSVSSVPAFLAAHLRRKFAQKPTVRKGEGKQSAPAIESQASIPEPERRLSLQDIVAFAATVADLLGEGKALEEIEAQFAGSMHAEDWAAVKNMTQEAQDRLKKSEMGSDG